MTQIKHPADAEGRAEGASPEAGGMRRSEEADAAAQRAERQRRRRAPGRAARGDAQAAESAAAVPAGRAAEASPEAAEESRTEGADSAEGAGAGRRHRAARRRAERGDVPAAGDASPAERAERKPKRSVLIERAVLFSSALFGIALAVGIVVYCLTSLLGAGRWAALWGLLSCIIACVCCALPLIHRLLEKSVQQISELRDVAVRVAEGDFDAHADADAPGELGELGAALNNLSHQLSRHMYMLIVERNRLKQMINGLSEGVIAVDEQGQVTHVNPAIGEMFEQKKVSLGLPDARMRYVPEKQVWEDFDAVIRSGEAITRSFTLREKTIRMTTTPIVDEIGSIAGAVGLFSDITQEERLERTRREYVSNVSHELRTPLTAVRALVEPLKEGMVRSEEDRQRYYDIILREVLRLSRLINDQLELSRLQSGNVAIQKRQMELGELILDVCDRYQGIAAGKGLELRIGSGVEDCPKVYSNEDRVEQLLIILLDNAIKYTEQGEVGVNVRWDEETVYVTVHDSGIGISAEDLPCVFDRFYKVDKAHSGKGSGLGLSIARELLNRMKERIWVESVQGEGSAFTFTLHRGPQQGEEEEKGE